MVVIFLHINSSANAIEPPFKIFLEDSSVLMFKSAEVSFAILVVIPDFVDLESSVTTVWGIHLDDAVSQLNAWLSVGEPALTSDKSLSALGLPPPPLPTAVQAGVEPA